MLTKFIPNFQLVDENNNHVKLHDLIKGNTVVFNMFYSNCDIKCVPLGKLLKKVNYLLKNYTDNIKFISVTLDAKNDTVDDINKFKQKVCDTNCHSWHFYTGNYEEIEILRHKLGMYSPEPDIDAIKANHTGSFMIFNELTGFVKHTQAFDNPVDIARKIIQIIPKNFYCHAYNFDDMDFSNLTHDEIFENIQTMNSVFTVPFLPPNLRKIYEEHANKQRGFQYVPPITQTIKQGCCCRMK